MALVGPVEGRGGASASNQVDVAVLERHGVGRVAHADDGDGLVFLRDIVRGVINDSDNKVRIATSATSPLEFLITSATLRAELPSTPSSKSSCLFQKVSISRRLPRCPWRLKQQLAVSICYL
jgi:hypothetical protein